MKARKRGKKLVAIIVIIATVVCILIKIFNDNISLFLRPADVYSRYEKIKQQKIRIGGMVLANSLHFDHSKFTFVITDDTMALQNINAVDMKYHSTTNQIIVQFHGVLPSLFKEGQMTVATGNIIQCSDEYMKQYEDLLHNNETICFAATEVLAKHDENYIPKPK